MQLISALTAAALATDEHVPVAIVGAGIAGLALAVALKKVGHSNLCD